MNKSLALAAFDAMLRSATKSQLDQKVFCLTLRAAKACGLYGEVSKLAMAKRADWLTWLTLQQRHWQQRLSKRPNRCLCRYFDGNKLKKRIDLEAWKTREKYVTCQLN